MADVDVTLTIPEAYIPRMKATIEWLIAEDRVDSTGVTPAEDGTITGQEAVRMFKRMTFQFWRGQVLKKERLEAIPDPDGIFNPDGIP